MSQLFLVSDGPERSEVGELLLDQGFELEADPPWTRGARWSTWARAEERVTYLTHALSGEALLLVELSDQALAERLVGTFEATPAEQIFDEVDLEAPPERQLATLYRLELLLRGAEDDLVPRIFDAQARYLQSSERLLRWAAARILENNATAPVAEALTAAAEVDPELAPVAKYVEEGLRLDEEGTLYDGPTDDWWELIRRAREGVTKQQWQRVEKATDALFESKLDHPEGLLLRALAYEGTGRPLLARALLGAAFQAESLEASYRDDAIESSDGPRLNDEIEEARARLETSSSRESRRGEDVAEVQRWLERWSADESYSGAVAAFGAAEALLGSVPELESLLLYIAGEYELDRSRLEQARGLAPESPTIARRLGDAYAKAEDAEAAERHYREALEMLRSNTPLCEAAQQIEDFEARTDTAASESALLEHLANIVYEDRRWGEAAALADELVKSNPDSMLGWQLRANARTFGLRHEEAVTAYEEALAALDRHFARDDMVYFGGDPRPLMQNNLAATLAKLGRREEALDMLRLAVRAEAKWGQDAMEDDYFEALWQDPEFLAIARAEPRALITTAEKTPEHLDELINRSLGLFYQGDTEEALDKVRRAAEVAEWEGFVELEVRALSAWGHGLALTGSAGQAVDLLAKAVALAEGESVSTEVQATALQNYGVAQMEAGLLDGAQDALERALGLLRQVYGEAHRMVAKAHGEMARLVEALGAPSEEVLKHLNRGVAIVERALGDMGEEDELLDQQIEALVDAATLKINIGHILANDGKLAQALAVVDEGLVRIDQVAELGAVPSPSLLENALELVEGALRLADNEDDRLAAAKLRDSLEVLLLPGTPEERAERRYWLGLRRVASSLLQAGISGSDIAATLSDALKGGDNLPQELRRVPEIAGFATAMAERSAREHTLIVTVALALETARADGDILYALEQLEGLCLASLNP